MTYARRSVIVLASLCHLLWASGPVFAEPMVADGLTIETFVSDIPDPTSLAFPSPGSAFTAFLYAASSAPHFGRSSEQFDVDRIFAISATGGLAEFATMPEETDPFSLAFPPPATPFGDLLYVSGNNRDGNQGGDQGGAVLVVDPSGTAVDFTDVPPIDLGEPADIAFGRGNDFGSNLYIANLRDWTADVFVADSAGSLTVFLNDGIIDPQPGGLGLRSIAFGPGGGFGEDLFVHNENCNCIQKIGPFGTLPLTPVPISFSDPKDIVFGPGGTFGKDLYAVAGPGSAPEEIWRVEPDGTSTLIASGFQGLTHTPLAFSPDGGALFVADYIAEKIYRISASGIDVAIDIKPGNDRNVVNLRSAGVVPVAIFSSDEFDATTIDPDTVSLAGASIQMVGKADRYLCHLRDVNKDTLDDLFCQVETADVVIEVGGSTVVLEAMTYDGKAVRGEDYVQIVPNGRRGNCPSHARCNASGPPPRS